MICIIFNRFFKLINDYYYYLVAPVCRPGQPKVYGVARNEPARIPCELEGNPTDIQFTWRFNNSGDAFDIPQSQIYTDRGRSVASYTPMTELDYGTLLCWGSNEIGVQKEPCVFYINPAGKYYITSILYLHFIRKSNLNKRNLII